MQRHYVIDHAAVASDIIDGEAIILHHWSGDYFSADGTGALVWQWIGESRSRETILTALQAGFPGAEGGIGQALDIFLADLLEHKLIREVKPDAGFVNGTSQETVVADPALLAQVTRFEGRYTPPVLHTYSDMREVLLVDPIHEVEEAAGWPVPKRPGDE